MSSKEKKLDAEGILRKLAELRKSIPHIDEVPPRKNAPEGRSVIPSDLSIQSVTDFDYLAVAEGLESLANDVSAAIEHANAKALEQALQVYYTAEELSKDPEHADLIPHVEAMRKAYEQTYGKPIPKKGK